MFDSISTCASQSYLGKSMFYFSYLRFTSRNDYKVQNMIDIDLFSGE